MLAVCKGRPVHLGHGGCGQRGLLYGRKQLVKTSGKFRLQDFIDIAERDLGTAILQFFQFVGPVLRYQVGPGRQNLAALDEGGAKFFENSPETHRLRNIGRHSAVFAGIFLLDQVLEPMNA